MSAQSPLRGLFLALAVAVTAAAGMAATVQGAPFAFVIDTAENVALGSTISIPVTKLAGADPVYGFDFLIQYDAVVLTLNDVTPGPVFDIPGSNEWESFTFSVDSAGNPTGLIHAVAVADIADGGHHPVDYHLADDAVLFTLEFTVTTDTAFECNWDPVWFYWTDCTDNVLALDAYGTTLGISDHVYQYDGVGSYVDETDPYYGFPGRFGAPDDCLAAVGVSREVDFYGGGLDIHCSDVIDNTGDMNCNGVAYEIADLVVFTNYFIYGISAFGDNLECSQQASDINYDGNELQWEDWIYLFRVVSGDAYPPPGPFPLDTAVVTFTQDDNAKTVMLDYPDSLAALLLVFDGEITPTININGEGLVSTYFFEGGRTIVMIMPSDPNGPLPSQFVVDGPILTYTGSALLIEASAADFNDRVFHTQIMSSGGDLTVPYTFEIGEISNTALGNTIHVPVVKTNGSEAMAGFDFLIGFDASGISITDVSPGAIFESSGDFQWEYLDYSFGPFDCGGSCPSGLIRVVGLADTPNGSHHPLETNIPDGTTLFTLFGSITTDQTYGGLFVPARLFWIDCGDNAIAFGAVGDSLALSDHVYEHNGVEITDTGYGFPGFNGAPGLCFDNPTNPPLRFANFKNGGINITPLDSMTLILSIDTATAEIGDTAIYVDVYVSNPMDSIAGFEFHVLMSQPDLIEFGRSPADTISFDVENTLTENWAFVAQQSLSGTYHDIRIYGISNSMPPYTDAIPPGFGGLLCRLIVHSYETIPPFIEDSTVQLVISELPDQTNFADPQGNTIGFSGGYDPATVAFWDGSVKITAPPAGDADGDGEVNVADAVYLINYIFKNGPAPSPLERGDADCDGNVNMADAVYLVNYIFKGGPAPCSI